PHIATKTVNFADISLSLHDALPICSLRINIACDRNVGFEDALDDVAHRGVETARCIHLQHDHIGPGGFGVVDALLYIAADGRTDCTVERIDTHGSTLVVFLQYCGSRKQCQAQQDTRDIQATQHAVHGRLRKRQTVFDRAFLCRGSTCGRQQSTGDMSARQAETIAFLLAKRKRGEKQSPLSLPVRCARSTKMPRIVCATLALRCGVSSTANLHGAMLCTSRLAAR